MVFGLTHTPNASRRERRSQKVTEDRGGGGDVGDRASQDGFQDFIYLYLCDLIFRTLSTSFRPNRLCEERQSGSRG